MTKLLNVIANVLGFILMAGLFTYVILCIAY
jgi:hypothetical protein